MSGGYQPFGKELRQGPDRVVRNSLKQLWRSQQSSSKRVTRATRLLNESFLFSSFFSVKIPSPISTGRFEKERVGSPCSLSLARLVVVGKSALLRRFQGANILSYQGHWPVELKVGYPYCLPLYRSSGGRSEPCDPLDSADTHMHRVRDHKARGKKIAKSRMKWAWRGWC